MSRLLYVIIVVVIYTPMAFSQTKTLKEQALDEFKSEHYDNAIRLLEQAVKENPNDSEIYYYLGWFNHYRAYDSRPLNGYDYSYSELIFKYLDKAIEINPDYGEAKYFYGAECSGNAFMAMQNYDGDKLKYYYELAYKKGAYPDWLIEFGRNILSGCEQDAILFTGGNADFDICSYLQLCENYRQDITVMPIGNIDRPWYIGFVKRGLDNCVKSVNINLTNLQIMDIHPFKWKETDIKINVSHSDKAKYTLADDYTMTWTVYPDLQSERIHAKIDGETPDKRTYLSPQRAMLIQIIEDNFPERPVYFTRFIERSFYGGLNEFLQNCGLVSKLIPFKTKDTGFEFDKLKVSDLLQRQNLVKYSSIISSDIPRISGVVMYGYGNCILDLAEAYNATNQKKDIGRLISIYKERLMLGFNEEYENSVANQLYGLSEE